MSLKWLRRWGLSRVLITMLVASLVVGVTFSSVGLAAKKAGDVVYGTWQAPDNLDPQVTILQVVLGIAWNFCDPLLRTRPGDPNFYPGLAESWEVSPDATVYTFHLRKDVKFHDGTPLTAEAVKFNLDRIVNPKTKSQVAIGALGPYVGSEVVDKYTVRVKFSKPYGSFLKMVSTIYIPIESPTAIKKWGDEYQFHICGTGPFMLKEYVSRDHVTFVRNPDYNWGPSWTQQGPPFLESITYRFIPEDLTRVSTLRTGECNVVDAIPSHELPSIKKNPKFKVAMTGLTGAPWILILNYQRFPTSERVVRQAIEYAIDQEALVDLLYRGTSEPSYSPVEKRSFAYDASIDKLYRYDPEKAKEILDKAGWKVGSDGTRVKDGKRLHLDWVIWPGGLMDEPAAVVQDQLREVGIEVKILSFDVGTAYPMWVTGDHNIAMPFYYWPDPQFLESWFGWNFIGSVNWGQYINPALDELMVEAEKTADPKIRAEIYKRAQEFLMIDAACVPLFGKSLVLGMAKDVHNIGYSPTGYATFYETYIE